MGDTNENVLQLVDIGRIVIERFLARLGIRVEWVADGNSIPATFWGEPEAGIAGRTVFLRGDTPVHSMLHEICHIICATPERRSGLHRDAGSDDLEESAVCYLQILLADQINGVGRARLMRDMDDWGYSFRLDNTRSWFEQDAADARDWLIGQHLLSPAGTPTFRMRGT